MERDVSHHATKLLIASIPFVLCFSAGPTAVAQSKLWDSIGTCEADHLGASVTFIPDLDGDGVVDVLAGATNQYPRGNAGRARVYSGATSALLLEIDGDAPTDSFGAIVASLGDVDGDGVPDFAIAAPKRSVPGVPLGAIFIYSGTGSLIRTFTSASPGGQVGLAMSALEDVDGDGVRDLLYSDWSGTAFTVYVVSGATGATIRSHSSSDPTYGFALGRTGDTDADGVDDYAICDAGHVNVYSGATGSFLFAFSGVESIVRPAGDVDLDGHADLILAHPGTGLVPVVSGATGIAFFTITGGSTLGNGVSATSDIDGDGHPDLVVTRNTNNHDPYSTRVYSGANGALLRRYNATATDAVDATADVDGDGTFDVVGGDDLFELNGTGEGPNGVVRVVSGASGAGIGGALGTSFASHKGSSLTVVNDRDGDGYREVAVVSIGGVDATGGPIVQILSGLDGHELSRFTPTGGVQETGHQLVLVGDVDGDGNDDLAVACANGSGSTFVEIRSGRDDSLLGTIAPPTGGVADIAAASEVNGAPLLAMTTGNPTNVYVFDLSTGVVVTTYSGHGNSLVSCVGDVDRDGFVDWVVEDSNAYAVNVFTGGPSPTTLWTFNGTGTDGIHSVTSTGDLDGDGAGDVLIGWDGGIRVTARSGATGALLFQKFGQKKNALFGFAVSTLGDVNLDGVSDFAVAEPYAGPLDSFTGSVYLYSGATAALLDRIDGDVADNLLGYEFAQRRWPDEPSVDPDGIPDLVVGANHFDSDRGRVDVFRLAPLFLQIDPPIVSPGQTVAIDTRGGPPGSAAGLFAVAFDATPIDSFIAFGILDSIGNWSLSGSVPPGFSGHSLTLRSYAIGFNGKVVASGDETLTFQ